MPVVALPRNVLSVGRWIHGLDTAIIEEVTAAYPHAWDEDHITYSWIARLMRQFARAHIADARESFNVRWQAFKAKGSLEHSIGDVAFIVNLHFSLNKPPLIGVGLLEAKRAAIDRGVYPELDWRQLERQSSGRSNHRVLLYDFTTVSLDHNLDSQLCCEHLEPDCFPAVHASSVPTAHILAIRSRRRSLAKRGLPLAYQIGVRYLRGFDLEYDQKLVQAVGRGDPVLARYVIVAHVSGGPAPGAPDNNPPSINPDVFERLPDMPQVFERTVPVIKERIASVESDEISPKLIEGTFRGNTTSDSFSPSLFPAVLPISHSRFADRAHHGQVKKKKPTTRRTKGDG